MRASLHAPRATQLRATLITHVTVPRETLVLCLEHQSPHELLQHRAGERYTWHTCDKVRTHRHPTQGSPAEATCPVRCHLVFPAEASKGTLGCLQRVERCSRAATVERANGLASTSRPTPIPHHRRTDSRALLRNLMVSPCTCLFWWTRCTGCSGGKGTARAPPRGRAMHDVADHQTHLLGTQLHHMITKRDRKHTIFREKGRTLSTCAWGA